MSLKVTFEVEIYKIQFNLIKTLAVGFLDYNLFWTIKAVFLSSLTQKCFIQGPLDTIAYFLIKFILDMRHSYTSCNSFFQCICILLNYEK